MSKDGVEYQEVWPQPLTDGFPGQQPGLRHGATLCPEARDEHVSPNPSPRPGRRDGRPCSLPPQRLSQPGHLAQAQEGDAKAILKAMSDYVSSQQTIELTFDSDIEVITPQLEKIQFTNSGEVLLSRPDKLRAHREGGYADVAMFFDGKTASVHGKNINGYAQFEAPGTWTS